MPDRHERSTLERLVDRLIELEEMEVPAQDRPIVEIAKASLVDAITEVSRCIRDGDYFTLPEPGPGPVRA